MSDTKPVFEVNQKIVYPSQGVGTILEVRERKFKNDSLLYYVIYLEVSDMTVMVPVSKCDDLGIRAIVSPEEAQKALDMMGEEFESITSDWKQRYQQNLDLLKKGTVTDIASIVRCLYHRSKVKELPILERKLYDSTRKLLEDEISIALGKTPKEIEAIIHAKLEPVSMNRDTKSFASGDDDFDEDDNEEFLDDNIEDDEMDDDEGDEE